MGSPINGKIIEMSNSTDATGRRHVKIILHEIYENTNEYNKNGISWNEQYTQNNIQSAIGMPYCVEFIDYEESEPYGHGESGVKDGKPLFEYSQVVGVVNNAYIDTVEVNGKQIKALISEGYLYEQRYPKFIQWLKAKMYDGELPESSVEICAKKGQDVIIYDGGWKEKGRVPMVYDYTGHAILGIDPADDNAVVLELNNKFRGKKGDLSMDEKLIIELNNKLDAKTDEVNNLKSELKDKEREVSELNQSVQEKDQSISELNAQVTEKNAKIAEIEAELNELKAFKQEAINKQLISELNEKLSHYSDEEKSVVKEKVETFSKTPSEELITEIINEINNSIVEKVMEKRKENKSSEKNSKNKPDDIYSDVIETNSDNSVTVDELY